MSTTATATALRSSSLTAFLLLASLFITLGAATESPPSSCADELVRFSPCLSYVASPPNNLSDSPPSKCCEVFSSAEESGRAVCLCYLVQDPPMLGFPVTIARVLSLSSVCPQRTSTAASTSLQSLCSESPGLPPLRNTTIPVKPSPRPPPPPPASRPPPPSVHHEPASSPSPKPANKSSTKPSFLTPPSSAVEPARLPSAASMKRFLKNNTSWFLPAILIIILI